MTEFLLDNCDTLDDWRLPNATMVLDTVDKTEGLASIAVSVPEPWTYIDLWLEDFPTGGAINVAPYTKLRLDIKPDTDRNLKIQLVTRTPGKYNTFDYDLTEAEGIVLGQWNRDFDIILANPTRVIGEPNMADIHLIGFRMHTPLGTEELKIDNIRLVDDPMPLTASLTPTQVTLYTTQPQTFQADIRQGIGIYTVEWMINDVVEATDIVGNAGDHFALAERTFNFPSVGIYIVKVRVTDSLGEQVTSNDSTVTIISGGILQIEAYADSSPMIAKIEVGGITFFKDVLAVWLPTGNHQITATYRTQTQQGAGDVLDGQTVIVTFQFTYEAPYPTSLHIDGRYIKNQLGQTVILKTVNRHGFEDGPEGVWKDLTDAYFHNFREDVVKANLDAMVMWGFNSFRIHFQCRLWLDPTIRTGDNGLSMRECFKLLAQWANERGLYVIFDAFALDTPAGYHQIPWGTSTFPTLQDFINFWLSMVAELDQYPNVIYELFNEVVGDMDTWLDGCHDTIVAMRGVTDHIIVIQYMWDVWYRQTHPQDPYLFWVYAITRWALDPRIQGLNILFATHMYGDSRGFYQEEGSTVKTFFHTYTDVKRAMIMEKLQEFVEVYNKPLWIGEYGEGTGDYPEWTPEALEAYDNGLTILDEWGISYCIMWWFTGSTAGRFALMPPSGPTGRGMDWNNPTVLGNIARSHLVPTPTPLTATLTATPQTGQVPLTVAFDILILGGVPPYSWTLTTGDGGEYSGTAAQVTLTHEYVTEGSFTATLTAEDQTGIPISMSLNITPGVTPTPNLKTLIPASTALAGGIALILWSTNKNR